MRADVHAVVAVWGKGAETLPGDVTYIDGVWIARGRALASIDSWLEVFESAHPTSQEVDAAARLLEDFVQTRDERESKERVAARA